MDPTPDTPPPVGGSLDDLHEVMAEFCDLCEERGIPYHVVFGMPSGRSVHVESNLYEYDLEGTMAGFANVFAMSIRDQAAMHQRLMGEDDS